MKLNAKDLYNTSVKELPPQERLRLAIMILNDMVVDDDTMDYSDTWKEQDLKDLTAFALYQEH